MKHIAALARAYGIQSAYYDVDHNRKTASRESLLAVLRALGAIDSEGDAGAALDERRLALWRRVVEPVVVAWDGRLSAIAVRLPEPVARPIRCTVDVEGGEPRRTSAPAGEAPELRREAVGGVTFTERSVRLRHRLPLGYHRLTVECGRTRGEALVISAPMKARDPLAGGQGGRWGAFAPLYALRSLDNWGAGDLGDMRLLAAWVAEKGGSAVMTLPLLATFLDWPFNPSPYSPVSRLFWNEMFIDVAPLPEMGRCPEARETVASPAFQRTLRKLRKGDLVDYRLTMALKRRVLEQLADALFRSRSARRRELERWTAEHPNVRDYAAFRAAIERFGKLWPDWPDRMRNGRITKADRDAGAARYHTYVQWVAQTQAESAAEGAARNGVSFFFDMPLGVDRCGYDVWRYRDSFVNGVNGGAPPDAFFANGQDWGFPPLSPDGERASGYRYFRAAVRHLLRVAGLLRIDHVMGLHRLYWIPLGMPATDGVYVKYPAEEMYAVLCLESFLHDTAIMGEDLGTVPAFVRRSMSRHNLLRSYVLQFELPAKGSVRKPPRKSIASLNTHDMPPFAAFWNGDDIDDRLSLGHIDEAAAVRQRKQRELSRRQLMRELKRSGKLDKRAAGKTAPVEASIRFLMDSPARAVIVNLEDLWQETEPQNMPGTTDKRPNWRRKLRHSLEELPALPEVNSALDGTATRGRRTRE